MTAPTLPGLTPATPEPEPQPRPGSRAARLGLPMALHVLKEMCAEHGVCLRPITLRRTALTTGLTELIDLPCGATREDKCDPCAKRARRLRQQQIREGWHRTDEPHPGPQPATDTQRGLILLRADFEAARDAAVREARWDQVAELDQAITEVEEAIAAEGLRGRVAPPHHDPDDPNPDGNGNRRKRSTRRRQDAPDLPRKKVERRTVGRVYTAPDGTEHRPSMWLSLTLDSYGRVLPDGTPVHPGSYDYRRAAWDAVHFARLLDRFWQNLRRCVGWNVQYAGCVEPQRRLAPHAHFAIRGTIPREVLRRVAAATYHQVWWPPATEVVYTPQHPPIWDADAEAWLDPDTREPLSTWAEALDELDTDPDAEPVHVVRFGAQVHAEGVTPGSQH
ncbi:MAG TPA: replication initiator, partial [Actinoplanes sp.]|nr:replication initiator [Actinoplanes sp.]